MINYEQKDINRLYDKITIITNGENIGCWKIDLFKNKGGYSLIGIKGKMVGTHRFMYIIHHQDENIDGKVIMHSCDNRWCVCPDHLSSGTDQDNVNDMINKGRQIRGDEKPQSKLSKEIIDEIITNILSGYFTRCQEIANHYKVSYPTINEMINEKYWTHITKNYDMNKIRSLLYFKLSEDAVRNIRQRLKNGETCANISRAYNVSNATISQIKLGNSYKNII